MTDDDLEFLLSDSTDNYNSTPTLLSSVSPSILPLSLVQNFTSPFIVPASAQLPVRPSTSPVLPPVLPSTVPVHPTTSLVSHPILPSTVPVPPSTLLVSQAVIPSIPPPHFSTPPKLQSVQHVMNDHPGTDVQHLRDLAIALARDAIFGKDELMKCSLSGRKHTGTLDQEKLDYIKMAVHSRVPNKSAVEFEHIWQLCRSSISKSCQALRTNARRKL